MARLPIPGSDDGTWGDVLNDFLTQTHNADGTLKTGIVSSTAISDGTISEAKLDTAVQTKLNAATSSGVTSVNTRTGAVTLTKSDVGLANVDNTSDANKPVSTAVSTALGSKENTITAGTTAQYFRGDKTFQTLDKTAVGLANVDNTSDANKPVSTATATALSGKASTVHTHASTDISDFAEASQDVIGAAIVAGSNITVNYNDSLGQVTIAATASGGTNATNLSTNRDATSVTVLSDTGTDAVISSADNTNAGILTAADKTKLDGVASGATANSSDATLLNRANHTGTQTASTISDFNTAVDTRIGSAAGGSVQAHDADLDAIAGLTPNNDDILQRKAGVWTNRTTAQLKTDLSLTKSDVGLANVDNTSDANKPVSTATQTALNAKANATDVGAKVLLIDNAAALPPGTPAGVVVVVKS